MKNLKSIDIPNSPGVYKFLNSDNKILYVGKSKNLKKRVKSYFQKEQNKKISNLVKETSKIDFIISESEHDALLLENNLIKENKPKYNILLRDDKTFPYIAISKDRFPKIYTTRKINHQKEEVFGPYTNVKSMRSILKLIKNLYKIRNCNVVLIRFSLILLILCLPPKSLQNTTRVTAKHPQTPPKIPPRHFKKTSPKHE